MTSSLTPKHLAQFAIVCSSVNIIAIGLSFFARRGPINGQDIAAVILIVAGICGTFFVWRTLSKGIIRGRWSESAIEEGRLFIFQRWLTVGLLVVMAAVVAYYIFERVQGHHASTPVYLFMAVWPIQLVQSELKKSPAHPASVSWPAAEKLHSDHWGHS